MYTFEGYEPVIGLEVHAQLQTESKIFCACRNAYGEPPNTLTCPVCLALPGALPVLNRKAVEFAMRTILATGGTVHTRSVFARKNYFYPDLPKGYQISQYDKPLGTGGEIRFTLESGEPGICRLIRIHLEEDAGKSLHPEKGQAGTRVDLNRCGAPLIEIVGDSDLRSPAEAYAYLVKLKQILQYLEVCSGDMEKGHLRCDANVSVRPIGTAAFGTRTEVKNMNSFKGVERALKVEIERQVRLLQSGGQVQQATMLWNEKSQQVEMMRSKEESHDYRYFPEPDLVPLVVSDQWTAEVREALPELPNQKAERFVREYGIRPYDATVLTDSRALADYFESACRASTNRIGVANWIQGELLGLLNKSGGDITTTVIKPEMISDLVNRIDAGELSGKMAKSVFETMVATGTGAAEIIKEQGMTQISDSGALEPVVDQVLAANPDNVAKYRSGKTNVFAFFVGQVMKATKGQANPDLVNRLLKQKLDA